MLPQRRQVAQSKCQKSLVMQDHPVLWSESLPAQSQFELMN
jgi:hypothetical protein